MESDRKLGKLRFYLTVKLKTYCCQFETFAKLVADWEGGFCWCVRKASILCAKFGELKFSSIEIVQQKYIHKKLFGDFMILINLLTNRRFSKYYVMAFINYSKRKQVKKSKPLMSRTGSFLFLAFIRHLYFYTLH